MAVAARRFTRITRRIASERPHAAFQARTTILGLRDPVGNNFDLLLPAEAYFALESAPTVEPQGRRRFEKVRVQQATGATRNRPSYVWNLRGARHGSQRETAKYAEVFQGVPPWSPKATSGRAAGSTSRPRIRVRSVRRCPRTSSCAGTETQRPCGLPGVSRASARRCSRAGGPITGDAPHPGPSNAANVQCPFG